MSQGKKLQEFKMDRSSKANILNIKSHHHFFESLFFWLQKNFSNQISDVKIFLPNQRSCRELRQLFLQKNLKNSAIILPKIKAISDLSFEDFFDFLPNEEIAAFIDEALQIKIIDGIDHLFFLSQKIQNLAVFGENIDAAQALSIATNLKDLFDEIGRDDIDLQKLQTIDDSDLSHHRQVTLEFLKNFYVQIKNDLIKDDSFFRSFYQNFITKKFAENLEKFGSKSPLIIAGSTGSVFASKVLIRAIARQENGYVILHALDQNEGDFSQENHPQFFLNELVNFLKIDQKQIQEIAEEEFLLSSTDRSELLSMLMLPAHETVKWQNIPALNRTEIEKNFTLINAKDEFEEARIISLILAENYDRTKKIAVITNNQKLAKLLKYELQNLEISFNDSRNVGIFHSNLVNFILLILDLIENDFDSSNLLAVLQNQLCEIANKDEILGEFENLILRQDRKSKDLNGILEKLKSVNKNQLIEFFTQFQKNIKPLTSIEKQGSIAIYSAAIISVIENLSAKKWSELLRQQSVQIELFELFNKLEKVNKFTINPKNAATVFRILFGQISYFEKSDASSTIQILSTLEARLLNHDLVIVASLNEGDFPQIESENWLGKKIKKDLGIERSLKKVGQNAYDFCNYLGNSKIILTRSLSSNGAPLSPSVFLLKLKTLAQKLEINFDFGEKYFAQLKKLNEVESLKIKRPAPKPALEFRPKKLAITDISKLISDPYLIYAKKILQLRELPKIDFEPSYAEFGSFVHKALEEFVKNPQNLEISLNNSYQIFEKYFLSDEAKLIWWPKFENIFSNFFAIEEKLNFSQNYTEIDCKLVINQILISGKIDRIALNQNNFLEIFDYKTGQISSKNEVISGSQPQLTIAALMLLEGNIAQFKNSEIASLNYWKVSLATDSGIKKISDDSEQIKILTCAAKAGLSKLFNYFADENQGYVSAPNLENYRENEYSHLARIKEWQ